MISFVSSPIITCIQNDTPVAKVIDDKLTLRANSSYKDLPLLVGIIRSSAGPEFAFSATQIPEYANTVEYYLHDKNRTFCHLATLAKDRPDPEKKALITLYDENNSLARITHILECLKKEDNTSANFWLNICTQEPVNHSNRDALVQLAEQIAPTDSNKALSILDKIKTVDRRYPDVYCAMGNILYNFKNDAIRAEWRYRMALCLDKTNLKAHFSLGKLLYYGATECDTLKKIGMVHVRMASALDEAQEFLSQFIREDNVLPTPTTSVVPVSQKRPMRRVRLTKKPPQFIHTTQKFTPETVLVNLTKAKVNITPNLHELASLL